MRLIEYIKGQRHGKDAHRLERDAMQDPFLSDAIDGFDAVDGPHAERIEAIRHRLSQQTRRTNRRFAYTGVAASLAVLLTVGGYFLFKEKPDDLIAKSESSVAESRVEEPAQEEAPPQEAESLMQDEAENTVQDEAESSHRDVSVGRQDAANVRKQAEAEAKIAAAEEADDIVSETVISPVLSDAGKKTAQDISVDNKVRKEEVAAKMQATEEQGQHDGSESAAEQPLIAQAVNAADKKDTQGLQKPAPTSSGVTRAATRQEKKQTAKVQTPEPKNGWKAYRAYLKDSLRRPTKGECVKSKGTVEVAFHIDNEGVPYDFVIEKSLCPDADAEAIRLVKEGSVWTCESFRRMTVEVKF